VEFSPRPPARLRSFLSRILAQSRRTDHHFFDHLRLSDSNGEGEVAFAGTARRAGLEGPQMHRPCYNFAFKTMAVISPFRAWRYAPEKVSLPEVVTQPYDKINPAMQEGYYQASPYNLVRIILGKRLASDTPAENVYTRATATFRRWRGTGVLRQDSAASIYRYSQRFAVPGSQAIGERRGFIALGRLEDYSSGVVFRHEQTLAKPKADRLDLLRATRAHFGQIFMLYSGAGKVEAALDSVSRNAPDIDPTNIDAPIIEVTDEYGVVHRVWKVSDAEAINSVQEEMRDQKLIIADGHHRYETALAYRDERRKTKAGGESGPFDYAMMTFVDMDRPGLVILPTHRAAFGLPNEKIDGFSKDVRRFFNVEEVDAGIDGARAVVLLAHAGVAGTALLVVTRERAFLLHTPKAVGTTLFGNLSLRQQTLDVVQLHKCVLENCLGISEEAIRNQENVSYFRDADEAIAEVRNGKIQAAFLMNPVRMQQVRDIAFAGEVLPQKSTDFYPKLLSGLTVYALE